MSATSASNPAPQLQHRDIRSASLPFKRDKEHAHKWSNGHRPLAGRSWATVDTDNEDVQLQGNIRPMKSNSQTNHLHKSHANKSPKPYGHFDSRTAPKVSAIMESNEHTTSPLSKSLLELLPQHVNNSSPSISTLLRNSSNTSESELLYSFDNKGPSPSSKGRKVDLGGLVEEAEKKWVAEQTERIVRGEYEVLDNQGEVAIAGKGKKRGSPKQRVPTLVKDAVVVEDDGFELI